MNPAKNPDASAELAVVQSPDHTYREFQLVANACKPMVLRCVVEIAGRRYVKVEGWTTIAALCKCVAAIESVENLPGEGVRAIAVLRRTTDLAVLSRAEGFVGCDEPDWYGGTITRWNKRANPPREMEFTLPKRLDHAIRAMAQTRAISRVLRGPFSFVITMIDEGLATVPAEEVGSAEDLEAGASPLKEPAPGSTTKAPPKENVGSTVPPPEENTKGKPPPAAGAKAPEVPRDAEVARREQFRGGNWRKVVVHFGANKDKTLGDLELKSLRWYVDDWKPRAFGTKPISEIDLDLRAALDVAGEEETKLESFRK
jgi:hypothetical protein